MSDIVTKVHAKKGDQSGLDAANKGIDDLKRNSRDASVIEKEATRATREATKAANEKAKALSMLSVLFPRMSGQLRALRVAIKGASFVGWLGVVTLLVSAGAAIYSRFFAPMIEGAKKSKAALKEWLGVASSIEGINAKYDATVSRINSVASAYDAAAKAAGKLADAQARFSDVKAQGRIDAMPEGPAKEQAKADLAAKQVGRDVEKGGRTSEQERLAISIAEQLLAAKEAEAAEKLFRYERDLADTRNLTVQADVIKQAKAAQFFEDIHGEGTSPFFSRAFGKSPAMAADEAEAAIAAGNITFAEGVDGKHIEAVKASAEAFKAASKETDELRKSLADARLEFERNEETRAVEKKRVEEETANIYAKQQREQAAGDAAALKSIADQMDKWQSDDDEKRKEASKAADEKAVRTQEAVGKAKQARAERAFSQKAPEEQKSILVNAIVEAIKVRNTQRKSGDIEAAANTDLAITRMMNKHDSIKVPKMGASEPTPGKTGFDSFLSDAAQSRDGKSHTKLANAFRSRLKPSGFGDLGKSFSANLMRGQLSSDDVRATLNTTGQADARKTLLAEENNILLREIRDKIGMRA